MCFVFLETSGKIIRARLLPETISIIHVFSGHIKMTDSSGGEERVLGWADYHIASLPCILGVAAIRCMQLTHSPWCLMSAQQHSSVSSTCLSAGAQSSSARSRLHTDCLCWSLHPSVGDWGVLYGLGGEERGGKAHLWGRDERWIML